MNRRVAIAAPGALAVEAGLAQVAEGGNAVDAAIAAVVTAAVTEPGIVSPMGGAFITVWVPGEQPLTLDGNVEMPGRGRPRNAFGQGLEQIDMAYAGGITVHGGHGSVATPGMFAALDEAHRRWGRVPWAHLMAPAAAAVRDGYRLGTAAAYYLTFSGSRLFSWHEDTRAFLHQHGANTIPTAGSLMRSPDLATTLDTIGREGAASLYTGELAHIIADDMAAHGGLLAMEDLAAYRVAARIPLRTRLGSWDVAVNPAPSIGGPVLTAMLRALVERHAARELTTPREDATAAPGLPLVCDPAVFIDVQRLVLGYRHRAIDLAEDLPAALDEMAGVLGTHGAAGLAAASTAPETIHVSVVDSDGLACSVTTSAGYGSGVTTPGTGLMLNNGLGEPELNRRGLHVLPPGTRLASNMAPTTARHDNGSTLAVGSPGADRITTALLQVLAHFCLDGMTLQDAIDAPRVHVAVDAAGNVRLEHEDGPGLREAARDSGLPYRTHEEIGMYFGGVGAALHGYDGSREVLLAAGDPRREAATGVG